MAALPPFHLAFPVDNLAAAREFWGETMGCPEGRSSDDWIDFDFHGHQIVAHLAPERARGRQVVDREGKVEGREGHAFPFSPTTVRVERSRDALPQH